MIVVYMLVGTLVGIAASLLVGGATGSILLSILAWPFAGSLAVLTTAGLVCLRAERAEKASAANAYPAE